jgi:hypothetical protein
LGLCDGACDPLDGEIGVIGFKGQQSHQVERVRMIWIDRKRLLATGHRIEIALGAHMADARVAE